MTKLNFQKKMQIVKTIVGTTGLLFASTLSSTANAQTISNTVIADNFLVDK